MDDHFRSCSRSVESAYRELHDVGTALDQACVIQKGEHPFIVDQTVINYARARIVTDAVLEQLRAAGMLQMLADSLSQPLLKKLRECAMISVTLSLEAADLLIDQQLVD